MNNCSYHITHNDGDAVGCALVAGLAYKDTNMVTKFCANNSVDKVIEEIINEIKSNNTKCDRIIISDIYPTLDKALELANFAKENNIALYGYDHHKTNACKGLDWWIIQEGYYDEYMFEDYVLISATEIMYNDLQSKIHANFNRDLNMLKRLEYLVKCISRYDTWEWKNHPGDYWAYDYRIQLDDKGDKDILMCVPENLIAEITKFLGPEDVYQELYKYYTGDNVTNRIIPDSFRSLFDGIEKCIEKEIGYAKKYVRITQNGEYNIATYINNGLYSNMVADAMLAEYEDIDIFEIIYPSSLTLGFRTKKDSIDVSRYAHRLFNGGGHKQASGAHVDHVVMLEHLTRHYASVCLDEFFKK